MTSSLPVIEMKNVTIELGGVVIFKDAHLKIEKGQCVVIIGPSGHGKTVLLKTLAGVFAPKAGQVFVEGEDWQSLESKEKHHLAEKIGMLFQTNALFDAMTVADNIRFPLREHHVMNDDEIEQRVKELLVLVNLPDDADKFPHELSGGMQRRLGIARALALSPEIIFYDDPTAGQDPIQTDNMAKYIVDLKEKFDSTLIVVTCDLSVAYQMADRIIMVVNDEVFEAGTPKTIKENPDPRVQQFIHGHLDGPIHYT